MLVLAIMRIKSTLNVLDEVIEGGSLFHVRNTLGKGLPLRRHEIFTYDWRDTWLYSRPRLMFAAVHHFITDIQSSFRLQDPLRSTAVVSKHRPRPISHSQRTLLTTPSRDKV